MGKLKALKPRLKPIGSRLLPATSPNRKEAEAQRYRERDRTNEWREWYGSSRWKALRQKVWQRDLFTCQKTGVLCLGKYPGDDSPVADHIIPHRGDPVLFWDLGNIQTVSKRYHDSNKQREEKATRR